MGADGRTILRSASITPEEVEMNDLRKTGRRRLEIDLLCGNSGTTADVAAKKRKARKKTHTQERGRDSISRTLKNSQSNATTRKGLSTKDDDDDDWRRHKSKCCDPITRLRLAARNIDNILTRGRSKLRLKCSRTQLLSNLEQRTLLRKLTFWRGTDWCR